MISIGAVKIGDLGPLEAMTNLASGLLSPRTPRPGRNGLLSIAALVALLGAACSQESGNGSGTGGTGGSTTSGTGGGAGSAGSGGGAAQGGSGGAGGQSGSGGSAPAGGAGGSATGGSSGSGPGRDAGASRDSGSRDTGSGPARDAGARADGARGDGPPASAGAPGCQGFVGKFCSDFELQNAGAAPNGNGDFTVSGNSVTVDGAKGFSGTKSLRFRPGGKTQLVFRKQFPFNEQHGRLMMFVTRTPPNPSHWDIVQSNSAANNIWSWGGMYGKFQLVVDPPDDGQDSTTVIPSGKWFCVQWHFGQGTGGRSDYHVKMDGAEVNKSPQIGHWRAGAWEDLLVGWEVFGTAPIEFWIDDLAFGEKEIACPAAP